VKKLDIKNLSNKVQSKPFRSLKNRNNLNRQDTLTNIDGPQNIGAKKHLSNVKNVSLTGIVLNKRIEEK